MPNNVNAKQAIVTTRMTLISHAATYATRHAMFPLDEPIEIAGAGAARILGPTLARADRAYSGPERRTVETAAALGIRASSEPILADIDLGGWAGKAFEEILAADPEGIAAWTTNPTAAPHGGESVEALIGKLAGWLEGQATSGGRIVAITHPAVIRAVIVSALGAPSSTFWRIDISPLAQVDLRSDGRRWTLRAIATP